MKKLPYRCTPFAFAFYMASMMGLLMCAAIVAIQTNLQSGYVNRVLHTYVFVVPIAFFCILLVKPLVMKLTGLTIQKIKIPTRFTPIVFSFYMAALMDFFMCCTIVAFQRGLGDAYWGIVLKAYLFGVPIAFCSLMVVRPAAAWLISKTVGHADDLGVAVQ